MDQSKHGLGAVTVTGWVALACVAALAVVATALAGFGVWRMLRRRGASHRYAPVGGPAGLKEGDV